MGCKWAAYGCIAMAVRQSVIMLFQVNITCVCGNETQDVFQSSSPDLKKMGSVGENVKSSGDGQTNKSDQAVDTTDAEYINPRGIRFTTRAPHAIESKPVRTILFC